MTFFKKYGFSLIKWIIFTASLYYLFQRIFFHPTSETFFNNFDLNSQPIIFLVITFILMFVNWGLEAYKWKISVTNIHEVRFKKAIAAVFAGTSISLFMPNRTGEFVGRIFALPKEKRTEGIIASIVTSYAQLNTTLLAGFFAICYYFYLYPNNVLTEKNFSLWIILPLFFLTLISILFYLKMNWFERLLQRIPFLNKYGDKIKILSSYSSISLLIFMGISTVRYVVFLLQFYLLILFFGLDISFADSLISIILTFYVSTLIPTFSLSEIGVRGSVAVLFFGFFNPSSIEVISASTLLWIINIGTPALIGNYFVARFKENS